MKLKFDRRRFLSGTFGSLGAVIAARVGWLFPEAHQVLAQASRVAARQETQPPNAIKGELFEGFLLLSEEVPEEAPLPDFVQCAPAPILCQVDSQHDPALVGEITRFNSIEELTKYISFPIYIPATLPPNMRFASASVIRFAQSGDIFAATINFGATDTGQSRIIVRARPTYPRPYPVWPVHSPVFHEKDIVYPEKAAFLPTPGVMRPSASGHVFNWIKQDILFTLVAELSPDREAAVAVAQSLVEI